MWTTRSRRSRPRRSCTCAPARSSTSRTRRRPSWSFSASSIRPGGRQTTRYYGTDHNADDAGSSREHAPEALQIAGITAVVAESYARIFYRNAVDGGFFIPCESTQRLIAEIKTGDDVEVNISAGVLKNVTSGKTYELRPLGDVLDIVTAGGIFAYARKMGMLKS